MYSPSRWWSSRAKKKRSVWIRTYHSQRPLLGHHVLRPPILEPDPSAQESDVVGGYQEALAAGDAERCTSTFQRDGCFREPSAPQYLVCGTANLTEFYSRFFSAGGGIILEHCTVTEDAVGTALGVQRGSLGEYRPSAPGRSRGVRARVCTGKIAEALR